MSTGPVIAIDLSEVRHPLFLLAAENDEVGPPGQLLAARGLVGSDPADIQTMIVPGNHLTYSTRHLPEFGARLRDCLRATQGDE